MLKKTPPYRILALTFSINTTKRWIFMEKEEIHKLIFILSVFIENKEFIK